MLEKVKDFFYDISDVILSILIIAIMFYTISWKLSDTMSYTPTISLPFLSSEEPTTEEPIVTDDSTHVAITDDAAAVIGSDTGDAGEIIDMTPEEPIETPEAVEPTTPEAAKPEGENINVITVQEVSFIVPSGMLASKIIQKLEDEGLIDDRSAFTRRLSERKLDSKLRSGTFQLSTDMTYDQIINKLTGQ